MKLLLLLSLFFVSIDATLMRIHPRRGVNGKYFIVGELHDRLGNQFFRIAATLSLAMDNDAEAIFPDLDRRVDLGIPLNREMIFFRLNTTYPPDKILFNYREDKGWQYAPPKFVPNMNLVGYFQSEKYFKHNWDKICPLFQPKREVTDYLKEKYGDILKHPYTVGIHLRDYQSELGKENKIFAPVGRSYIDRATEFFPEEAFFVIFSDNIEWAKKVMGDFLRPHCFIEGEGYIHDLFLMSGCRHQIISNSTFSWWAAYLNPNPQKRIIAPKMWFHPDHPCTSEHIIPPEWTSL